MFFQSSEIDIRNTGTLWTLIYFRKEWKHEKQKEILSILLTLCMMFALVPMTALAAEDAAFEVIDTEGNATQFTKYKTHVKL